MGREMVVNITGSYICFGIKQPITSNLNYSNNSSNSFNLTTRIGINKNKTLLLEVMARLSCEVFFVYF